MDNESISVNLDNQTPESLLEKCQQAKPDNSHEPFCFELFRRAIAEKSTQCWDAIYQQYQKLVYSWTIQYAKNTERVGDATIEEVVLDAFTAFWRAFTVEKLDKAQGIGSVLSYLKSCAATSVLQAQRKVKSRVTEASLDQWTISQQADGPQSIRGPEQSVLQTIGAEQVWAIVDMCCHDAKEEIIARLSLVSNLKPNLILQQHPDLFRDAKEIYIIRRNLKNRLSRNPEMRKLWGEAS